MKFFVFEMLKKINNKKKFYPVSFAVGNAQALISNPAPNRIFFSSNQHVASTMLNLGVAHQCFSYIICLLPSLTHVFVNKKFKTKTIKH